MQEFQKFLSEIIAFLTPNQNKLEREVLVDKINHFLNRLDKFDHNRYTEQEILLEFSKHRSVVLNQEITEENTRRLIAYLLYLDSLSSEKEIYFYIHSLGGSIPMAIAIYDTIQNIKSEVVTIGYGCVAGAAAILLSAGTKGKRVGISNSRIVITKPFPANVDAVDTDAKVLEIGYIRQIVAEILAQNTGQPLQKIYQDTETDYFMSVQEAIQYGIIDQAI